MAQVVAPRLMLVLDRAVAGSDAGFLKRLATLFPHLPEGGSVWLQLRCKGLGALPRRQLLEQARVLCRGRQVPVVVNGGGAGFDGVHWPQSDIGSTTIADGVPLSAAVHDRAALDRAQDAGVGVAVFAPVFDPRSKPGRGRGIPALRFLCARSRIPVLALGGVTPERVRDCLDAGAHGVAILSPVSHPDHDLLGTLAAYLGVLSP